ncbi:MAG: DUF192 domain-containing protein [Planctomycetota bacterium]
MRSARNKPAMRWITRDDARVLSDSVQVADTYFSRLIGLQFRRTMPTGEVLWLQGCKSIHTAWMRFRIDVVFLDDAYRIVDVHTAVPPWRIVRSKSRSAKHVVEARQLVSPEVVQIGMRTAFEPLAGGDQQAA